MGDVRNVLRWVTEPLIGVIFEYPLRFKIGWVAHFCPLPVDIRASTAGILFQTWLEFHVAFVRHVGLLTLDH